MSRPESLREFRLPKHLSVHTPHEALQPADDRHTSSVKVVLFPAELVKPSVETSTRVLMTSSELNVASTAGRGGRSGDAPPQVFTKVRLLFVTVSTLF